MRKHATDGHLTPWEHHPDQSSLHFQEVHQPKAHENRKEEQKIAIVHSNHQVQTHQERKIQLVPKINTIKQPSHIKQFLEKLEQKAALAKLIEEKLHPHLQNKKVDVFLKPIPKNEIYINVPEDPLIHPKITIERPIKHMNKNSKEPVQQFEKHEAKHSKNLAQLINIKLANRKLSVDSLHRNRKASTNDGKRSHQYEDLVIKKCNVKNINLYEDIISSKTQTKFPTIKDSKPRQGKHLLDRLLAKLQ